jgi:hypothetical protein
LFVTFTKFLQYIIFLLYPPSPILRIVSTGLIFCFHTLVRNISTTFMLLHHFLMSSPLKACFWGLKQPTLFLAQELWD